MLGLNPWWTNKLRDEYKRVLIVLKMEISVITNRWALAFQRCVFTMGQDGGCISRGTA